MQHCAIFMSDFELLRFAQNPLPNLVSKNDMHLKNWLYIFGYAILLLNLVFSLLVNVFLFK